MRHVIRFVLCILGLIIAIGSALVVSTPGAAGPVAAPGQGTPSPVVTPALCGWNIVPGPSPISAGQFYALAAITSTDIWAVGEYSIGSNVKTLAAHWDGSAWTTVTSPSPGAGFNRFLGVAAVATNDVWAVGEYLDGAIRRTLAAHWDGSQWSLVPSPSPGGDFNYFRAVAAPASNDVWAVGDYSTVGSLHQTLIAHWDGSQWSVVPSPNPGTNSNELAGVAAVGSNDVWAVGDYSNGSPDPLHTLIVHWDGSQWSVVPSPDQGDGSFLFAVTALAGNDVWAVGSYWQPPTHRTLTAHWDGTRWSIVGSPNLGHDVNVFRAVAARTPNDVWAVGYYTEDGLPSLTLTAQWNGSCWRLVDSPNPGSELNALVGVAAPAANDIWAIGEFSNGSARAPLAARYTSPCVTPTPTPCPLQFADVPSSDPFYPYIQSLACRGVFSGYTCGGPGEPCPGTYFRPGASLTRGQAAKIIANAAGITLRIPPAEQIFEDVPPGHPFWIYVERLAIPIHGYINGYACGQAPAGPCVPPLNRLYFLPAANVTRGQLAKLAANTAGYLETPAGQTFEDVPPTQPFYLWIERVALRGVLTGYACGQAPAGPCVPPANRPYFLPANNSTRAQTVKIVANTFYPGCPTPAR